MMRWISGIVAAIIVVFLLFYVPQEGLQSIVVFLSLMAFYEYFDLTQKGMGNLARWIGLLWSGALVYLLVFWVEQVDQVVLLMFISFVITCLVFFNGPSDFSIRLKKMALFFLGIFYVSLFAFWGWIIDLDHWRFWVFIVLGGTFLADTGAYLVGHWIGKHKLASQISPGKTIEGLLGGCFFALLGALIIWILFRPDYPLSKLIPIGLLVPLIGPVGDLSESLIKRGVDAKDSGSFLPGHGGLLDRVDALLFTAPVVYYYAKLFP